MFWKKIKSSEYIELLEKIDILKVKIATLEIELQLYVKKLRASKGVKDLKEEKPEDLNKSVFLKKDGTPLDIGQHP